MERMKREEEDTKDSLKNVQPLLWAGCPRLLANPHHSAAGGRGGSGGTLLSLPEHAGQKWGAKWPPSQDSNSHLPAGPSAAWEGRSQAGRDRGQMLGARYTENSSWVPGTGHFLGHRPGNEKRGDGTSAPPGLKRTLL